MKNSRPLTIVDIDAVDSYAVDFETQIKGRRITKVTNLKPANVVHRKNFYCADVWLEDENTDDIGYRRFMIAFRPSNIKKLKALAKQFEGENND